MSKSYESGPDPDQVVVAFVTYNANGNNLYLDNLTLGERPTIADGYITSIVNIPPDTNIAPSVATITFEPQVNIVNLGLGTISALNGSDSTYVYFKSSYNPSPDSVALGELIAGDNRTLTFPSLEIMPGNPFYMTAYINYLQDTIRFNDTLYQTTYYVVGRQRNVMFQEFTSANSLGAIINNSPLNTFLDTYYDSIVAVKYHWGVPDPNDSMYIANKGQADSIIAYYNPSGVPQTYADGNTAVNLPYSTDSNLIAPYNLRRNIGAPVTIDVSDTLIGGNIISTVNVNVLFNLPAGDYRLKVNAVERIVRFDTIPTNWYDSVFVDVFRAAYPGVNGISIPTIAGRYPFQFVIPIQPGWHANMIYSAVYVQNQNTKEILNSQRGKDFPPVVSRNKLKSPLVFDSRRMDTYALENPVFTPQILYGYDSDSTGEGYKFFAEIFEGYFLPQYWRISNPDAYLTFYQASGGFNGPSFFGNKSVKMPFFDYTTVNTERRDTLFSRPYYGLRDSNTISFDYAYAQYSANIADSLKVIISVDGGETFPFEVFNKGGGALATAPATTLSFGPASTDWLTFTYPLAGIVNVKQISSSIPELYSLDQNYPNPFNPETNISFSIPSRTFVSLKVYDITGREIRSYVNSFTNPGSYSVNFTGEGLASGIYFYSLQAGDFRETKKMVLVK